MTPTRPESFVDRFEQGNGYVDAEEVLWSALMVCRGCARRQIDCRCRGFAGCKADERLLTIGRDLKRKAAQP